MGTNPENSRIKKKKKRAYLVQGLQAYLSHRNCESQGIKYDFGDDWGGGGGGGG